MFALEVHWAGLRNDEGTSGLVMVDDVQMRFVRPKVRVGMMEMNGKRVKMEIVDLQDWQL